MGQLRAEVMMYCNVWMAFSLVPCMQGPSCCGFMGKLVDVGSCGRRGQRQSFGPVVTYEDGFVILIKSNDQCFGKEYAITHTNKGGEPNKAVGEAVLVMAFLAGHRQGRDQCKFATCNTLHRRDVGDPDFNCGCCGIIVVDRCTRGKVIP